MGLCSGFLAFFWLRVFPAPKQNPRPPTCGERKLLGRSIYQNYIKEVSVTMKWSVICSNCLSQYGDARLRICSKCSTARQMEIERESSWADLIRLLRSKSPDKLEGLAKILGTTNNLESIINAILKNSQHSIGYFLSMEPSYLEIVSQTANKLKIKTSATSSPQELETAIAQKVLTAMWEKMTPEQRLRMDDELQKAAQRFDKANVLLGGGSILAMLTTAQLSGFGIYLAATTALGALTSTLGITLPFIAYTTMTSAIGLIIGPVGWIGLGFLAVWQLTGPNHNRIVQAILYIRLLRSEGYLLE